MKLACGAILVALTLSLAAVDGRAQPFVKVPRIGFLGPSVSGDDPRVENFRQFREGLHALGYVEGKTIRIEWRLGDTYDVYPALAAELVRLNVDVLVVPNTQAALATKRATTTIPIVFTSIADPVGSGLVESLARPGGNMTGLSNMLPDLGAKRLQLLKETVLKGASPATLPVEQPTKFELIVNLRTAKALGLTISQSLLLRVDHVVE